MSTYAGGGGPPSITAIRKFTRESRELYSRALDAYSSAMDFPAALGEITADIPGVTADIFRAVRGSFDSELLLAHNALGVDGIPQLSSAFLNDFATLPAVALKNVSPLACGGIDFNSVSGTLSFCASAEVVPVSIGSGGYKCSKCDSSCSEIVPRPIHPFITLESADGHPPQLRADG